MQRTVPTLPDDLRLVYASSFDVSRPDGPGVNEQMFVVSMARVLGDRAVFVIPRPRGPVPEDFPFARCLLLAPFDRRKPLSWIRHQLEKFTALRRLIGARQPDLLVIRPDVLPLFDLLLVARHGIPYCTKNAHVSGKTERQRHGLLKGLLFRIHYAILERLFAGASAVDVVSAIHRHDLIEVARLPAAKVIVSDNAADTSLFLPCEKPACKNALGLGDRFPVLGYVGNLAAERGASELIAALPALAERYPGVHALVVEGDSRSTRALRDMSQRLGVGDRVSFRGPVPLHEVPAHIGAMDVCVSFRDDDGCSELKVRQYLACGRPVVVSAGVNRFVVEHELGSLVDRNDQPAIRDALAMWSDKVRDASGTSRIAERTSRYAREHLDTDAANEARVKTWLQMALQPRESLSGRP